MSRYILAGPQPEYRRRQLQPRVSDHLALERIHRSGDNEQVFQGGRTYHGRADHGAFGHPVECDRTEWSRNGLWDISDPMTY